MKQEESADMVGTDRISRLNSNAMSEKDRGAISVHSFLGPLSSIFSCLRSRSLHQLIFGNRRRTRSHQRRPIRVYLDGCFDLMHFGHANALRQARMLGDELVVGVVSDKEMRQHKGPPVLSLEERVSMVKSIKWVDEVIPGTPYALSPSFLQQLFTVHRIDFIVHGDDPCLAADGSDAYAEAKRMGRFKAVKRTEGVSSTDILGRILEEIQSQQEREEEELHDHQQEPQQTMREQHFQQLHQPQEQLQGQWKGGEQDGACTRLADGCLSTSTVTTSSSSSHSNCSSSATSRSQVSSCAAAVPPSTFVTSNCATITTLSPASCSNCCNGDCSASKGIAAGEMGGRERDAGEGGRGDGCDASSLHSHHCHQQQHHHHHHCDRHGPRRHSTSGEQAEREGRGGRRKENDGNRPQLLLSASRLAQFANHKAPRVCDSVVYFPSSFDVFHPGHVEVLRKARSLGSFLLVGLYDDGTVSSLSSSPSSRPLLSLHERCLSLLSCHLVDDVILGAPLEVSQDLLTSFNVSAVVSCPELGEFPSEHISCSAVDPFSLPKRLGIFHTLNSPLPSDFITLDGIVGRVGLHKAALQARTGRKVEAERQYYSEKKFFPEVLDDVNAS